MIKKEIKKFAENGGYFCPSPLGVGIVLNNAHFPCLYGHTTQYTYTEYSSKKKAADNNYNSTLTHQREKTEKC
jgi:hypothetical protein